MTFLKRLIKMAIPAELAVFPPIDDDLREARRYLRGRVLNAGAGARDISHLIDGELVNQDLASAQTSENHLDIIGPLHEIPVDDEHFDAIVCIAVLEHVENPEEVMAEFRRVLKSTGYLVLEVPFLQPEHKAPTDYQRYTRDGLETLVARHGMRVISTEGLFTVYHTLYWQVYVWLHLKRTPLYVLMRLLFLHLLAWRARRSRTYSDRLASGFRIIAQK